MGRKISYVNEKQNRERIDRAVTRVRTLEKHGGTDVQIGRAKHKLDDLLDAGETMRGWHPRTGPEVFN